MKKPKLSQTLLSRALAGGLACTATMLAIPVNAAVNIPDLPLQSGSRVPPNIMFILDDSGSMEFTAMPESRDDETNRAGDSTPALRDTIQDRSVVHNSIYYDPRVDYLPWIKADGSRYTGGMDYKNVYTHPEMLDKDNGVVRWDGRTPNLHENLSSEIQTFYVRRDVGSEANNYGYYKYTIDRDSTITRCEWNGTEWDACVPALPVATRLINGESVSNTTALELKNFATWYSYHRTRMKVAKAGASEAFYGLSSGFRVGYDTIWNRPVNKTSGNAPAFPIPVNTDKGKFSGANKQSWFGYLHAATANSSTPLRGALSRAGRYYETSAPWTDGTGTPEIFCRQSFAILTTDGFWNDNSGYNNIAKNADGAAGPPYQDGFFDTLADIAMYYWQNDLRPTLEDPETEPKRQLMNTFSVSIGLQGTLNPETDLPLLEAGTLNWPNPMDREDEERIDDLWHAAVNGRGKFVTANNSEAFREGLASALATIAKLTSSRSSLSANSTSVSEGTLIFQSRYTTGDWSGDVRAFEYTSAGLNTDPKWNATIPAWGMRKIFTEGSISFPNTAQQGALGTNLVNYLKGERTNENSPFRARSGVLGDIVHSTTVFVEGKPATLAGVDTDDTIYVGANDGMLHAFNADDGKERFAYVPGGLNLAHLAEYADKDYVHRFFVDGAITVTDRKQTPGENHLVAALGRGGKGLFSLDVSNPESFQSTDLNWDQTWTTDATTSSWSNVDKNRMGYILGKPLIAMTNDGRQSVIVGNGVNSNNGTAALFVIDLETGAVKKSIPVTDTAIDNGLMNLRGLDLDGDSTVDAIYGGDLRGNLWKFDLRSGTAAGWKLDYKVIQVKDGTGGGAKNQPITGGLSVAFDPTSYRVWIVFGTGQLFNEGDLDSKDVQSLYGVIDPGSASSAPVLRSDLQLRKIDVETEDKRAFEQYGLLPPGKKGWVIDLVTPTGVKQGERVTSAVQIVDGQVRMTSQIPADGVCSKGGTGWLYAFDAFTGTSTQKPPIDTDGDGDLSDENIGTPGRGTGGMKNEDGMLGDMLDLGDPSFTGDTGGGPPKPVRLPKAILTGRISWQEKVGE